MKRCPKCGRTFTKDAQKFCTHDGGALVPSAIDPNATVQGDAPGPAAPDPNAIDAPIRAISRDLVPPSSRPLDPYGTMAGVKLPPDDPGSANTGPANQPTSPGPAQVSAPLPHSTSAPLPPAISAQLPPPAALPAPPLFVPPSPPPRPAKKSKMPLILAVLAILLLVGLGALAAGYFFFLQPMLEAQKRTVRVLPPEEVNQNTNTNVDVPTPSQDNSANSNIETEPPPFVPPANAVEFVNSKANLDGKLAEHYLDFSFYYPESWRKDPQAGVPGSSDFVKVERRLPPDFTQENFTVGWYESGGSLAADRQLYPNFIEAMSTKFEKGFPNYRKLSEGEMKVNSYDAYEFRFQSVSEGTAKGDITLWGRVIFLPPKSGTNGAILLMTATSLAPELSSADDVGVKGGLPIILESFRLGAQP